MVSGGMESRLNFPEECGPRKVASVLNGCSLIDIQVTLCVHVCVCVCVCVCVRECERKRERERERERERMKKRNGMGRVRKMRVEID